MECPEEQARQSEFSPSIVLDDEILGRFISHSHQLVSDRRHLATAAFQTSNITTGNGFSVLRLAGVKWRAYRESVRTALRKPPDWIPLGVAVADCSEIRALVDAAGSRLFCVIDDGLPQFASHVLIRPASTQRLTRRAARGLRLELMSRFTFWPGDRFFSE